MLKETRTYVDYNGVERTEDFYFNLTKAELSELELTTPGGFQSLIQTVTETKDVPELIKIFKKIILLAYGEKSADGRRLMKSEEISKAFSETEAYSDLFMELVSDADKASTFINGIIPKLSEAEKAEAEKKIEYVNISQVPDQRTQQIQRPQPQINRGQAIH